MLRLVGFLVAGMAIWLIAAGENAEAKPADRSTVWLAVMAGRGLWDLFYGAEAGRGADGRDLAGGYVQDGEFDRVFVDAGGDVAAGEKRVR